jgi:hypothetical protein
MRQATDLLPPAALGAGRLRWMLALGWWLTLGWWLRRGLRSALGGGLGPDLAPQVGPPTRPRRPKQARPPYQYPHAA